MDKMVQSTIKHQLPLLSIILVLFSLSHHITTVEAFCYRNIQRSKPELFLTALKAGKKTSIVVALTREHGKNEKLRRKIIGDFRLTNQVDLLELPCIEHAEGPDFDLLASMLKSDEWDYVAITSPEAAGVLASAWDSVREDPPLVVAVGKATEKKLYDSGIPVAFVPSMATAETLAKELELLDGKQKTTVLYPASVKAKRALENGLASRGFAVTRINTYDTVTATWEDSQRIFSEAVQIACFGSPSAVEGWLQNTEHNTRVLAACIGGTSASACKELGWSDDQIFFPTAPGLDGWVEAIQEATESVKNLSWTK